MPQPWAIWFAVDGDLRFLSHHDMMRLMERIAARGDLPLRYTQGFNPHPVMSLVCPRPVGVGSRSDVLALTLDEPMDADDLLERLRRTAPPGLHFEKAVPLASRRAPQPTRIEFRLLLGDDRVEKLRCRTAELDRADTWPIERRTKQKNRRRPPETKTIDLRRLVERFTFDGDDLIFTLAPDGATWARPGEVLGLLGLDQRADLAHCVRTRVEYDMDTADNDAGRSTT